MNVHWLPERGYNVFLLDYRGYGLSEGDPDLEGAQADIQLGLDWLAKRCWGRPQPTWIGCTHIYMSTYMDTYIAMCTFFYDTAITQAMEDAQCNVECANTEAIRYSCKNGKK